jgi:hypothetical protein
MVHTVSRKSTSSESCRGGCVVLGAYSEEAVDL